MEFPITYYESSYGHYTTGLDGCSCTNMWGCSDLGYGEYCQNGGFAGWSYVDNCNGFRCGDCGYSVADNPVCVCEGNHALLKHF